jgi:hypothetical protein
MWMMKLVWLLTALWGRREALVYCGSEDTKGASIAAKRKGADANTIATLLLRRLRERRK